jgi:hypothetical protein
MPSPSLLLMPTSSGEVHAAEAAEQPPAAAAEAAATVSSSSSSKPADCCRGFAVDQSLAAAAAAADRAAAEKAAALSIGGSSPTDSALPDAMPSMLYLPGACKGKSLAVHDAKPASRVSAAEKEEAATKRRLLLQQHVAISMPGKTRAAPATQHGSSSSSSCWRGRRGRRGVVAFALLIVAGVAVMAGCLASDSCKAPVWQPGETAVLVGQYAIAALLKARSSSGSKAFHALLLLKYQCNAAQQ